MIFKPFEFNALLLPLLYTRPKSTKIIKLESKSLSSNEELGSNMYNSEFISKCVNNEVGTLSRNAFADLKQQQIFYQKQHQDQSQRQEDKDSAFATGSKNTAVAKILSGDVELCRASSPSTSSERCNNSCSNNNEIPLVPIEQKHKQENQSYRQNQEHQTHQRQHSQQSGKISAKSNVIQEDIMYQEYSSKLSLILNDRK